MLKELRKGSTNILIKGLLLLVVLSFIIWGVGDLFRGHVSTDVATVGEATVSLREFDRTLRQQIKRIQAMTGGAVTSEQIAAMQVDRMVLNQIVNTKLIELEAGALGVRIGKDVVQDQVANDPSFADASGKFDKHKFLGLLNSNDLTESDFVALVKSGMASDFLVDGITSAKLGSDAVANALYAFRNEARKVDLLTLTEDNVATDSIPTPSESDLMAYYNAHKEQYAVPEYRKISYITLKTDAVLSGIAIADEDLQKYYDEHKDQYQVAERRDVDNMLFSDEAKAKEAWERLNKQEDFYQVAKEMTDTDKADVDLGRISKDAIFKDVADVVFSLDKEAYSAPVKGPFGWYIFRIRDILPASEQSIAELKDTLTQQLRSERAGDVLTKRINDVEDAFASGSTLEEVAKTYQLDIQSVDAINAEGKDTNGETAALPNHEAVLLKLAFTTNQGEVSPLTVTPGNVEYIAVRVDTVTEQRTKALDEVNGLVQTSWKQEKRKENLKKQADALAETLNKGAAWQDAIQPLKVQIETGKHIGRQQEKNAALPPALQAEIFTKKAGEHTAAYPQGTSYLIARVQETIPAAKDDVKINAIREELSSSTPNDLMEQYNLYLRSKYPVTVNEQVLKKK